MPVAGYTALGFWKVEVFPLPKSHSHDVGLLVERSAKLTVIGKQPLVMSEVKLATGGWAIAIETVNKQLTMQMQQVATILI